MAKCQKCGNELKGGAKFCSKCGAKVILISPEVTAKIEILRRRIEKDPLDPRLYVEIGAIYLENGLFQEALIEYQKAVSIDNSYFDAHLNSGKVYLELRELEKSERSYQKAFSLKPDSADARLGLFRAYHLQNKLEQAIEVGEEVIKTDPGNLEVHKILKEMYDKKGMKEKVLKELEIISSLAPEDKESLKELSELYAERGETEKEFKCYERVFELDPKDIETRFNLGKWFCVRGEYKKTIAHLEDISSRFPHERESYVHLYLSLAYINQQELNHAIKEMGLVSPPSYENLTDQDKKLFAEAYSKIGFAVSQNKNFSAAIDYLERALKYEPQSTEYQKQLEAVNAVMARSKTKAKKRWFLLVSTLVLLAFASVAFYVIRLYSRGTAIFEIKQVMEDGSTLAPSTARLYVDDSEIGNLEDNFKIHIKAGKFHRIIVRHPQYYDFDTLVMVRGNQNIYVPLELKPRTGSLHIDSAPPKAQLTLDSKVIGNAPLDVSSLIIGEHRLEAKLRFYSNANQSVMVVEDSTNRIKVGLEKGHGQILLTQDWWPYQTTYRIGTQEQKHIYAGSVLRFTAEAGEVKVEACCDYDGNWYIRGYTTLETGEEKKIDVKDLLAQPESEKGELEPSKIDGPELFSVRAYNCDDQGTISVNGEKILEVGYQKDSGWQVINSHLHAGNNIITFWVDDFGGGWTYGFQLKKAETVLWQEECGLAGSEGCTKPQGSPHAFFKEYVLKIE